MKVLKVYTRDGTPVDSFTANFKEDGEKTAKIKYLNSIGYYVRKQFSHSGKTLVRSYV